MSSVSSDSFKNSLQDKDKKTTNVNQESSKRLRMVSSNKIKTTNFVIDI